MVPHARLGKVSYDNEKLAFFAGYHKCDDCGNNGKILLNMDDVRELQRMFGTDNRKQPVGLRITQKLAKHYNI